MCGAPEVGRPTTLGMLGSSDGLTIKRGILFVLVFSGEHSGCAHVCGVCMCAIGQCTQKLSSVFVSRYVCKCSSQRRSGVRPLLDGAGGGASKERRRMPPRPLPRAPFRLPTPTATTTARAI